MPAAGGTALEAGEMHITFDLYERIMDLCGWPGGKNQEADDPDSSASLNFAEGRNVTHP